jgi:hypothetical protein
VKSRIIHIYLIIGLLASCSLRDEEHTKLFIIGEPLLNVHGVIKDSFNSNAPNVCEDNLSYRSSALIIPKIIRWRRYDTTRQEHEDGSLSEIVTDHHYGVNTRLHYGIDGQLVEKSVFLAKNYLPIGQWYYWSDGQLDSMRDYEDDLGINYYQACDIAKKHGIKLRIGEHDLEASFTLEWRDYQKFWSITHWAGKEGDETGAIVLVHADNGELTETGDRVLIIRNYHLNN